MARKLELLIVSGENAGMRYSVSEKGLRLGRSSSNDIHIPDEQLSRNHCMFEVNDHGALLVSDLASANGTFVNGVQIGAIPQFLKIGDTLDVGITRIKVVQEHVPGQDVDLGLSKDINKDKNPEDVAVAAIKKVSIFVQVARVLFPICFLIGGIIVFPMFNDSNTKHEPTKAIENKLPELTSLTYEKIEADSTRIFRYYLTLDEDGVLNVSYDDVPEANRHVVKSAKLNPRAMTRIKEILETKGWDELESSYTGPRASDENELKSWRIRTVQGSLVRDIIVENMLEPEAFKIVREALETFSRNELGIWAIQYSRDQLISLSEESKKVGDAKFEEREVEYGNLSAAIDSYREAIYYLETVNPKPEGYAELKSTYDRACEELDKKYKNQRFLADKAINLADWDTAHSELRILCAIVPNKNDPRHDEANAKLLDVEKRMKKNHNGGTK